MSNENKTIHDFELNLICDFFSNMERQGPGSPEATLKALSFVDGLTDKSPAWTFSPALLKSSTVMQGNGACKTG